MARLPRLVAPHQPHHLIQRGIDRQPVFREAEDYAAFLKWLREAAKQFRVAIHAYALLPDHLQLLVSPSDESGLGRMMQWVGRHYVPYFNQKYGRAGTLWQGRYRAAVIDAELYLLASSRYIELAPVRDGIVMTAAEYAWSSSAHHLGLKQDPLITDHGQYWALGNTPFGREAAYRDLLEQGLAGAEVREIGDAVEKGWVLGPEKFKMRLQKDSGRRVSPGKRGRPAKKPRPENSDGTPF